MVTTGFRALRVMARCFRQRFADSDGAQRTALPIAESCITSWREHMLPPGCQAARTSEFWQ